MKKILLAIISLFVLPLMVSATEYQVSDLDLTVDIPDNYLVITRDNYKNNQTLIEMEISEEYMEETFNSLGVYVDAYDDENKIEIFLVALATEDSDTANLKKEEIENYKKNIISSLPTYVVTENEVEVVKIGNNDYFALDYFDETYNYYVYDLYYVKNGIQYTIKIQSPTKFTDEARQEFNEIVESMTYSDKTITLSDIKVDNNKTETKVSEDKKDSNIWLIVGIGAVLIVAIALIVYIVKRKKNN